MNSTVCRAEPVEGVCFVCKGVSRKSCKGCISWRRMPYCSRACQRADWIVHKEWHRALNSSDAKNAGGMFSVCGRVYFQLDNGGVLFIHCCDPDVPFASRFSTACTRHNAAAWPTEWQNGVARWDNARRTVGHMSNTYHLSYCLGSIGIKIRCDFIERYNRAYVLLRDNECIGEDVSRLCMDYLWC